MKDDFIKKAALVVGITCSAVFIFALINSSLPYISHPQTTDASVWNFSPECPPQSDSSAALTEDDKQGNPDTLEVYQSPIDFKTLQAENPDICAWLEIPGTKINYPILYREGDNSYYLTRNSDGNSSSEGSIFIEDYNQPDFEDPVVVIYGHNMKSKTMFGELQPYFSDGEWFSQNQTIYAYLPDKTIEYAVFAAVPYSKSHILYYNNFRNERRYHAFFDGIYAIRSLTANFNSDNDPDYGDHVLILSTCLNGDRTQRYLVMAKEVSE